MQRAFPTGRGVYFVETLLTAPSEWQRWLCLMCWTQRCDDQPEDFSSTCKNDNFVSPMFQLNKLKKNVLVQKQMLCLMNCCYVFFQWCCLCVGLTVCPTVKHSHSFSLFVLCPNNLKNCNSFGLRSPLQRFCFQTPERTHTYTHRPRAVTTHILHFLIPAGFF